MREHGLRRLREYLECGELTLLEDFPRGGDITNGKKDCTAKNVWYIPSLPTEEQNMLSSI